MRKYFILILTVCSILMSCKPDPVLPTVATYSVSDITETSATCTGAVTDNGNAEITAKGFCWSTEQNPTLEDNFTTSITRQEPAIDVFTSTLHNLTANTKYYVRAYATNSVGTSYGQELDFVTIGVDDGNDEGNDDNNDEGNEDNNDEGNDDNNEEGNDDNNDEGNEDNNDEGNDDNNDEEESVYEFVDLALPSGVKWASFNVGATALEEYGEYFAWGELKSKDDYQSSNCVTNDKDIDDISGNPEYDVATSSWGDGWRMPTVVEMNELKTECNWTWYDNFKKGVSGYKVESKTNGNFIFLPTSGFRVNKNILEVGTCGYYWTSTPYEDNANTAAYYLDFNVNANLIDWGLRRTGFAIRPVKD